MHNDPECQGRLDEGIQLVEELFVLCAQPNVLQIAIAAAIAALVDLEATRLLVIRGGKSAS